jgi:two-component system chemotaxis response regulator CheB
MAQDEVKYKKVVIGGSAGSLEVILNMVGFLPASVEATYVIVIHRKSGPDSILAPLLASKTKMKVIEVEDQEPLLADTIYLAPPDYHLLIENKGKFSLDSSEKIHWSKPSIDVTFESVADIFGPAAIAVLLSGANDDGAVGLKKIKQAGGFTIIQNPEDADVGYMPASALKLMEPSIILNGTEIGAYIANLLKGK